MSDEHSQRPFRTNNMPRRQAPAGSGAGTPSGSDPLAELARLIGQTDPFGEFGRKSAPGQAAPAMPEQTRAHPQPYMPAAQARQPAQHEPAQHEPTQAYRPSHNYGRPGAHDQADYRQPDHGSVPPPAAHGHDAQYADDSAVYEYDAYDPNNAAFDADESGYYDEPKPRRRSSILAVAAVFTLAVIGTGGALGYRALFGRVTSGPPPIIKADPRPSKIVPAKKDTASAKLINDRVGSGDEKLVPREEQPVEIKPAGAFPGAAQAAPAAAPAQTPPGRGVAAGAVSPSALGSGVIGGEPKKIHTIVIHPDRTAMAGPLAAPPPAPPQQAAAPAAPAPPPRVAHTPAAPEAAPLRHQDAAPKREASHAAHVARAAPPANAPLSLSPNAEARTAAPAAAPTRFEPRNSTRTSTSSGKYAVQLSSRRSQSEAEAAFRSLKAKFPSQLGSRQSMIRKVDLGKKGIYYRTMVGPFATSDEASKLCSNLKAAGGSCFVQRI
jgi:hypothetical protein